MKHNRSGAYEPQMVSIGPYHHGEEHLRSMEEHKHRSFLTFLERSNKPLRCYVHALAPVVDDLRGAYHELDPKWKHDPHAFLQLMIVDGCFILEIMRIATAKPESLARMGYAGNDPIFSEHGKLCFVPCLMRDMLMLENQIPLLVLATLLATEDDILIISDGVSKQYQLSVLILKLFYPLTGDIPEYPDIEKNPDILGYGKCLHILELYHRSMLNCIPCKKPPPKERCSDCLPCQKKAHMKIQSATELTHAGIRFRQSETECLNDVSFRGGVLKLPQIVVDNALESQYLNMIAFEQFHADAGTEVTSFVVFMDNIINGARDVELLRSCDIIDKALSSNKACSDEGVAKLFNSMSRDITMDDGGGIAAVQKKVDAYCRMPLPRCTVYSKRTYEHVTSWVSLSILGAISFFALTSVLAVYTVLTYYHSK